MGITVHKPRRIPLLFFLGIGIPCLLLGYLAFRGIQNDQALLEKEKVNEHRKILDQVTKSIEENISEAEQSFIDIIAEDQEINQPILSRSIDSLKRYNPLVEEVFFYENSGEICLPAAKFLYLSNRSSQLSSGSAQVSIPSEKVQIGQQSEFQDKNYRKALASYRQEFGQASDPRIKGELLNAIGRVQKKSTLFRDAEKTYETIARDYNNIQIAGGVPLGLAARSELSSLYIAIQDSLTALKTFLDLYKDLLNSKWTLEKAQYDFISHHIKESVDDIFSKTPLAKPLLPYQSTFTALKKVENGQRNITERLITFQENAEAVLKAKIAMNPEELRSSGRRFIFEDEDQTYLVSILDQTKENDNKLNQIQGLLLNANYLRDSLLRKVLQENVNSVNTAWIVKGRDDITVLKSENSPSGSVTVRTNFINSFPPWSVELYQQTPDLFNKFLFTRRGIYFYAFLLLAGILVFGLILTNRTISHELELSKMKSDFVSTISHEFKSPLSSIRQLSEMLQSGRVPSEAYRQQYYDVLVEQSERLSLLIDNILDFSKIEEGKKKFYFEMIDIGLLLHEIISVIQDQVRHKKFDIQLKIEKPLPLIKTDRTALAQAITNLIDNAIKYSGESRIIVIRASTENQYAVISVKDFGIGIRKEEINKVFERFYRGGDELTRKVKGSGLGLTLVKQIVDVHDGKIEVESEVGKGSVFTVRLPLIDT